MKRTAVLRARGAADGELLEPAVQERQLLAAQTALRLARPLGSQCQLMQRLVRLREPVSGRAAAVASPVSRRKHRGDLRATCWRSQLDRECRLHALSSRGKPRAARGRVGQKLYARSSRARSSHVICAVRRPSQPAEPTGGQYRRADARAAGADRCTARPRRGLYSTPHFRRETSNPRVEAPCAAAR